MNSHWWPTPARPSTWFSAEQLEQSRAYNVPLRRVALWRTIARSALLSGLALLVRADHGIAEPIGLSVGSSWLVRILSVSLAVTLAWWLPSTGSDWWFDRRHEPRFGSDPLPAGQLAVGTAVAGIGTFLVVATSAVALLGIIGSSEVWWLFAVPASVGLAGISATGAHRISMLIRTLEPLDDEDEERFERLADRSNVDSVSFWRMSSKLEDGCNALTTAGPDGRSARVAVTPALLEADVRIQELLVAHELAHVRMGHLRSSAAAGVGVVGLAAVVLACCLAWGNGWFVVTGALPSDPRSLPALCILVWALNAAGGIPTMWLSRAHERYADDEAFLVLDAVPLPVVKAVHITDRADLDPGFCTRLVSAHPPPAERLQRASLMIR